MRTPAAQHVLDIAIRILREAGGGVAFDERTLEWARFIAGNQREQQCALLDGEEEAA